MGLSVVDAGVLIGLLDGNDAHHAAARGALEEVLARNDRMVLPASAFAEVLVGPSRKGAAAVRAVHELTEGLPIEIAPLDASIAVAAAAIRGRHRSLKLPDALVIATAAHLDADHLLTTDRGWPSRSRLGLRASVDRI